MIDFLPYWLEGMTPKVISALWFILPAYVANASPTLLNGKHPIDFGRKLFDGKRVLGDGKTWEGLFGGIFIGTLFGLVMLSYQPMFTSLASEYGFSLKQLTPIAVLTLSIGTLVGDAAGSFIKRRSNLPRGTSAPFLDQLSFVIGALYLTSYYVQIPSETTLILLLVTPAIHWFACIIGYLIGVKNDPW